MKDKVISEEAPIKIVVYSKYPGMYRLQWKDGTSSVDMYNLTRAKDILRIYSDYVANMKVGPSVFLTGYSLNRRPGGLPRPSWQ